MERPRDQALKLWLIETQYKIGCRFIKSNFLNRERKDKAQILYIR